MNNSSSLRSRWEAGCAPLLLAWLLLFLTLKPVDAVVGWLARAGGPETTPSALIFFRATAFIVLGPLGISLLIRARSYGWGQTLKPIFSFWLQGLKAGIYCLLIVSPLAVIWIIREYFEEAGMTEPGSTGARLAALLFVSILLVAPFWTLPLVRRLSQTVLGRNGWFEDYERGSNPHTYASEEDGKSN